MAPVWHCAISVCMPAGVTGMLQLSPTALLLSPFQGRTRQGEWSFLQKHHTILIRKINAVYSQWLWQNIIFLMFTFTILLIVIFLFALWLLFYWHLSYCIFSIGGFLVWRLQGFSLMLFLNKHLVLLGKQICLCLFCSL